MKSLDDSKMMKLVRSLTDQEFKELGLWVNSPIHNSSEKTIKLYAAIKNRKNGNINSLYLLKEIGLAQKGQQKKDISLKNIQDLRNNASRLTVQIEQFLIWKQNSKNPIRNNRALMDQLISRQLYDVTQSVLNKSNKSLEANPLRDLQYCKSRYELDEMQFYLALFSKNRSATDTLKQVVSSLQNSCISQLLRYYGALANSKNLISGKDEFTFVSKVKNHIETDKDMNHFTIEIYYKLLILLQNRTSSDYFAFKERLFSSFESFDRNELRQFFGFMTNFCIEMIANGQTNFVQERFEIYKQGLSLNCWTAGVYFSRHQFLNIVMTGLKINKYEWVKMFIDDNHPKLDPKFQQDTLHLSKAMLAFENEAYSDAQQFLFMISKSEDFMHHALMEVLLIKIFYINDTMAFENFNFHPIHSRIKAFQAYLKIASGNKLSSARRAMYSNFLLILKQIIQIKRKRLSTPKSNAAANRKLEVAIRDLKEKCMILKPLTEEVWLLKQIEAIVR